MEVFPTPFGIHTYEGRRVLIQRGQPRSLDLVSLEPCPVPLIPVTPSVRCPHHLILMGDPVHMPEWVGEFVDNPVVDLFLPKPRAAGQQNAFWIKDGSFRSLGFLRILAQLCGMQDTEFSFASPNTFRDFEARLRTSNFTPLVLQFSNEYRAAEVQKLVSFSQQNYRPLICLAPASTPCPQGAVDLTKEMQEAMKFPATLSLCKQIGITYLLATSLNPGQEDAEI
jgi:hypothetical protein